MSRRGLFLPAFDPLADPRVFADVARQAEEAGWDGIFVWDHLLYADPVVETADPGGPACVRVVQLLQRLGGRAGVREAPVVGRRPTEVRRHPHGQHADDDAAHPGGG